MEVERGAVALSQLDNYREQIRLKTKENRDLQLHSQGLVAQLKNVPYLQSKLTEMSDELQDYKMRAEKIPGLLAEVSKGKAKYLITVPCNRHCSQLLQFNSICAYKTTNIHFHANN